MDLSAYLLEPIHEAAPFVLYRGQNDEKPGPILVLAAAKSEISSANIRRLEHEFALSEQLDPDWAVKPKALSLHEGRVALVFSDPGGLPLAELLTKPLELKCFLRLAIGIVGAVRKVHARGLIHRDLKPANIFIDNDGNIRLTGFGFATVQSRSRQSQAPPDLIAGTLAYMAPEQTGRMNRSVDTRSDLYALGITFYQLVTGELPFVASDPVEWIHCHVARQPLPPGEKAKGIPPPIEAIILKLLAKTGEERYQTAAGLEHDLRHCLEALEVSGRIESFTLATRDRSERLIVPERVYGRVREATALRSAFDRVRNLGTTEFVLVTGEAGIGKSSFVNELPNMVTATRAFFATGKADRQKSNIPYAPLAQAIGELVTRIISDSGEGWGRWRASLLDALGPNAQIILALVPDLALVVGEQLPVPTLSPQDEKSRFLMVIRRFLGVFAQPEHPLILFLDDLQWLDRATIDLLTHLVVDPELTNLLIVGAYRSKEISDDHPLAEALRAFGEGRAAVTRIALGPLTLMELRQLITDALQGDGHLSERLARTVFQKTGGNPFFVAQWLTSLVDEGLLAFDPNLGEWKWDAARTRARAISDNVVDLMADKLNRLPKATLETTKLLACLGDKARTSILAMLLGLKTLDVYILLSSAVAEGLISHSDETYSFAHDRIRDAAYAMIPEASRPAEHLRIGRAIWASVAPDNREESIFEIVNHYHRGAALIWSPQERQFVAELNLAAGRRARASAAYTSALTYLTEASGLLPEDCWDSQYRATFDIEYLRAECEYLIGDPASALQRLFALSTRAVGRADEATVTCLRMAVYTTIDQSVQAIKVGLEFLARGGLHWPLYPTDATVNLEIGRLRQLLGGRSIEELSDLPEMIDPECLFTVAVLAEFLGPATFSNNNMFDLALLRIVNLSIEHGNCPGSPFAYALLNVVLGLGLGDFESGLRFGQLACKLVKRQGFDRLKARVYMAFGTFCLPWTTHLSECHALLRGAIEGANAAGDLSFEAYARLGLMSNLMSSGEPLLEAQQQAEAALLFARKARFGLAADCFVEKLMLIRDLRGYTNDDGLFEEAWQDRAWFEQHLETGGGSLASAACRYWTHRVQERFFARDIPGALIAAEKARPLVWSIRSFLELVEYHFYIALVLAADCDTAADDVRARHMAEIGTHQLAITKWAIGCPENCAHRKALIDAEIARLTFRDLDALRLYDEAIRSARDNGFVQNEAVANELAARFHYSRGLPTIADAYARAARHCYLWWGADAKVRQLDAWNPGLRTEASIGAETVAAGMELKHLDLAAVVAMSQAISSEIVLDRLIERLMETVVEHAGAVRGLLLLRREGAMQIVAEAVTNQRAVVVSLRQQLDLAGELPETMLNYVARTQEVIILGDATTDTRYAGDAYVVTARPRSALCLPLIKQKVLVGVLYLENNLTPHLFTQARLAVLRLLATQAAISIENAELFLDIQKTHEAARRAAEDTRRAFDMIPTLAWTSSPDGTFEFANNQWHNFTGISEESAKNSSWIQAFHADDIQKVTKKWTHLLQTGVAGEIDARMLRFDGESRAFLVRATPLRDDRGKIVKWYGMNTDIDDIRRVEEAQRALATMTRLSAVAELTVSIAHEINQPLMAIVTNAEACLQWLTDDRFDLTEARQAAERIVRDGHRAGDIISSVRALARKTPTEIAALDLNGVIAEVVALMRGDLHRSSVELEMDLALDAGFALGDRLQLQQVIRNLVANAIEAMIALERGPRRLQVRSGREDPGHVFVSISDTGIGLDPGSRNKIFKAFFTTKPEGIGLGLSICRSIIETHGGRLWVSPNVPRGTTFHLTLPASERAPSTE